MRLEGAWVQVVRRDVSLLFGVCFCSGIASDASGNTYLYAVPLRGAYLSLRRKVPKPLRMVAPVYDSCGAKHKVGGCKCSLTLRIVFFVSVPSALLRLRLRLVVHGDDMVHSW